MKLENRLAILFGSLSAVFVGALITLHLAQKTSTRELQSAITTDKTRQLERIIELEGTPLERFTSDYTQWDDMCRFVESHDPQWAEINIAQSLIGWQFQAAWVFAVDGNLVYRHLEPPFGASELQEFPTPPQLAFIRENQQRHFFMSSPQGLLEVRTAPIHPSDDSQLQDPPHGWFVVARMWDAPLLEQFGKLTECRISLTPAQSVQVREYRNSAVEATIPLADWTGKPLRLLTLEHNSPLLANMIAYDFDEIILFLAFGVCLLGVAAWFLHHWVRQPLHCIEASLANERPDRIVPLETKHDEFAKIASLIRTAAEQRLALRREIEDRTFAEHELRRAIVERTALGRDLHDGVIQSIYAVGMTLQGVGALIGSQPDEAQKRITTCVEGLNRTIGQLRNHIAGMEKDLGGETTLEDGVRKLIQEMKPAREVTYEVRIDPILDRALPPDSVVQLLFIVREAVSNAIRHGRATRVALQLDMVQGEPALTVEDDGVGFTPETQERGHGLDNMTRRAEEIGAALTIESIPERGTQLRVELPLPSVSGDNEFPAPTAP